MNPRLAKLAHQRNIQLEAKLDTSLFADREKDKVGTAAAVAAGAAAGAATPAVVRDYRAYTAPMAARSAKLNARATEAAANPLRASAVGPLRQAAQRSTTGELMGYAKSRLGKIGQAISGAAAPAKAAVAAAAVPAVQGATPLLKDASAATSKVKEVLATAGRKARRAVLAH